MKVVFQSFLALLKAVYVHAFCCSMHFLMDISSVCNASTDVSKQLGFLMDKCIQKGQGYFISFSMQKLMFTRIISGKIQI